MDETCPYGGMSLNEVLIDECQQHFLPNSSPKEAVNTCQRFQECSLGKMSPHFTKSQKLNFTTLKKLVLTKNERFTRPCLPKICLPWPSHVLPVGMCQEKVEKRIHKNLCHHGSLDLLIAGIVFMRKIRQFWGAS